jgi:glutamine phosphoribosylpyrophosphate amidotransferase
LALCDDGQLKDYTHKGLLKQEFPNYKLEGMQGNVGIGVVATDRQPISELTRYGGLVIGFDGNIVDYRQLRDILLKESASFSGYKNPDEISDGVLVSKVIARQTSFEKGIEKLAGIVNGDYAVVGLTCQGIYAARGWGRKPLVIGKKRWELCCFF